MRCPVPYAILALFGWGLADAVVTAVRPRLARALRAVREVPNVFAARGGPVGR
ncbi:MAG: hypothetical protein WEE03_06000 [Chloroflexota bacterium]